MNVKLTENTFNTYLRRELLKIGINHRSHDCRVTFSRFWITQKLNRVMLDKIIGHTTGNLTQDTYTDFEACELVKEIQKLVIP